MQFDLSFFFEALWGVLPAVPMTLGISAGAAILGMLLEIGRAHV